MDRLLIALALLALMGCEVRAKVESKPSQPSITQVSPELAELQGQVEKAIEISAEKDSIINELTLCLKQLTNNGELTPKERKIILAHVVKVQAILAKSQ